MDQNPEQGEETAERYLWTGVSLAIADSVAALDLGRVSSIHNRIANLYDSAWVGSDRITLLAESFASLSNWSTADIQGVLHVPLAGWLGGLNLQHVLLSPVADIRYCPPGSLAAPIRPKDRWRVYRASLTQLLLSIRVLQDNVQSLQLLVADVRGQLQPGRALDLALGFLEGLIKQRQTLLIRILGLVRSASTQCVTTGFGSYGSQLENGLTSRISFQS